MVDLPKRKLGRTGLNVTALGFGALELRGMIAGVEPRTEMLGEIADLHHQSISSKAVTYPFMYLQALVHLSP
jgi:hypothetical protein